jgi:hypothetical protein
LLLLITASIVWAGLIGWRVYERLRGHHLSLAAGARTAESYRLAKSLQSVTTLHALRLRLTILEIEAASRDDGVLEQGVVQLAIAPGDLPTGPSARSVALLAGATPQLLLTRYDVDEEAVDALMQALTQFSQESTPAKASGNAATPAPAAKFQQPPAPSAAPLHPGAAAFYDREQTPFLRRYAKLMMFVLTGLILLVLWGWLLRRRTQRKRPPQTSQKPQTISFSSEPWTFAKILRESVEAAAPPSPPRAAEKAKKHPVRLSWRKRNA